MLRFITEHISGIVLMTVGTTGFLLAWRIAREERYAAAVIILMLCGLLLRIYAAGDPFLHQWDEKYHAVVAKNLTRHPLKPTLYENPVLPADYTKWDAAHVWVHKQPVPLWAMAASMALFGFQEFALRIPSLLLSTLAIALTFVIGSYMLNKKAGFIAAFLFAINGFIVEMTGGRAATDHIDVFFLCFITLSVFCIVRFVDSKKGLYNVLAAVSLAAAILSKWLPALIVLPVWMLLVKDSKQFSAGEMRKHFFTLAALTVVLVLPWQLFIYHRYPEEAAWEAQFNWRHITEVLENHHGTFMFYLNYIRIDYGDLIYLPVVWFLFRCFRRPYDYKRMALAAWFLVPLLFFSSVQTKMEGYILFIAPALFIVTADFWQWLVNLKVSRPRYIWIINIILFLLIALPVRYSIQRIRPFMDRSEPAWVSGLKALNKELQDENYVLFNYPRPVEAMFYTRATAYAGLPPATTLDSVLKNGIVVLVNEDSIVTPDIKALEGIRFVHLPVRDKDAMAVSKVVIQ